MPSNRVRLEKAAVWLRGGFAAIFLLIWAGAASAQTASFQLSGVSFPTSEYLAEAELQAAIAPYMNRPITFEDVEAMVADVQALYLARGVVTARALIEPQEVTNGGVLRMTLVEAEIEVVTLGDTGDTDPAFLRDRLSIVTGEKPDFEALAKDIRLFEVAYDIAPRLVFGPGDTPGTASAEISVVAPEPQTWILSFDTSASESLGREQLALTGIFRSVSGQRDTFSTKLTFTEGSEGLALGYTRPVGLRGGSVTAALSWTESEVVTGGFSALDVDVEDRAASLGYARPFAIGRDRYWTARVETSFEQSKSNLTGVGLTTTILRELDAALEYRLQAPASALSATVGLKMGEAQVDRATSQAGSYRLLYGSVSHARRMGGSFIFDAILDWQWANGENLPVKRRFSAGGVTSLRGFEKDARTGDSGAILRLQATCAAPCHGELGRAMDLAPFAFMDLGYVKPFASVAPASDRRDHLISVGAGFRANVNDIGILAFVGKPVTSPLGVTDDRARSYFGIDYRF